MSVAVNEKQKNKVKNRILDMIMKFELRLFVGQVNTLVDGVCNGITTIPGQAFILYVRGDYRLAINNGGDIYLFVDTGVIEMGNPGEHNIIKDGKMTIELIKKNEIYEPIYDFIIYHF